MLFVIKSINFICGISTRGAGNGFLSLALKVLLDKIGCDILPPKSIHIFESIVSIGVVIETLFSTTLRFTITMREVYATIDEH